MNKVIAILMMFTMLVSCGGDDESLLNVTPVIELTPETLTDQVICADETELQPIAFHSNYIWRIDVRDVETRGVENTTHWLHVKQLGGGPGSFVVQLFADVNETGETRKAEIILTCGDKHVFTVSQKGTAKSDHID